VVALAGGTAAAGDERPPALRVVTFNLLHGGPASGWRGDGEHLEERLAMVTRELQELAPRSRAVAATSPRGWRRRWA